MIHPGSFKDTFVQYDRLQEYVIEQIQRDAYFG